MINVAIPVHLYILINSLSVFLICVDIVADIFIQFPHLRVTSTVTEACITSLLANHNMTTSTNASASHCNSCSVNDYQYITYLDRSYIKLSSDDHIDITDRALCTPKGQGRESMIYIFSVLKLCGSSFEIGAASMSIADALSVKLLSSDMAIRGTSKARVFINVIRRLLLHGKEHFSICASQSLQSVTDDKVAPQLDMCNTYLKLLSVIMKIPLLGGVQKLSLSSFCNDASRIRDALLDLSDKGGQQLLTVDSTEVTNCTMSANCFSLAMEVCSVCSVDTTPIYIKWAHVLLRGGKYEEAREKVKVSFHQLSSSSTSSYETNSKDRKLSLLHDIINEVESASRRPSMSLADMHEYHRVKCHHILDGLMAISTNTNDPAVSDVHTKNDDNNIPTRSVQLYKTTMRHILTEGLYYINTYGTPEILAKFLVQHGCVKDAISIVVKNNLTANYFVEHILTKLCIVSDDDVANVHLSNQNVMNMNKDNSGLQGVVKISQISVKSIVSSLTNNESNGSASSMLKSYLKGMKEYLFKNSMLIQLREMQILLQEYTAAGVTTVALFASVSNSLNKQSLSLQDMYLMEAKSLYKTALSIIESESNVKILSNISVSGYVASPSSASSSSKQVQKARIDSSNLMMKVDDIKHIYQCISMQEDVLPILREAMVLPVCILCSDTMNTASSNSLVTHQIQAVEAVLSYDFDLGVQFINLFNLSPMTCYVEAVKKLIVKCHYTQCENDTVKKKAMELFDSYMKNLKKILTREQMVKLIDLVDAEVNEERLPSSSE